MPFFADGEERDKLTLMYFLDKTGRELTREQLTTAAAERGFLQFFELQNAVNELEEQGLLAAVPRPYGQAYAITPAGKNALDMFYEQLPLSLRYDIDEYAVECADRLKNITQYYSVYEKSAAGYSVTLKVMEKDSVLMSLQIVLPDIDSAKKACAEWPERAAALYKQTVEKLVK